MIKDKQKDESHNFAKFELLSTKALCQKLYSKYLQNCRFTFNTLNIYKNQNKSKEKAVRMMFSLIKVIIHEYKRLYFDSLRTNYNKWQM